MLPGWGLSWIQTGFPVTDRHADDDPLPLHHYLTRDQLSFVVESIAEFYRS
jgi:hypothetical protein